MIEKRKIIAFDLDTKALQKYYPGSNWRKAYQDIRKYMEENSFKWQEGSCYLSNEKMSWIKATDLIERLSASQKWLNLAVKDCVLANAEDLYSQTHIFKRSEELTNELLLEKEEKVRLERKEPEEENEI